MYSCDAKLHFQQILFQSSVSHDPTETDVLSVWMHSCLLAAQTCLTSQICSRIITKLNMHKSLQPRLWLYKHSRCLSVSVLYYIKTAMMVSDKKIKFSVWEQAHSVQVLLNIYCLPKISQEPPAKDKPQSHSYTHNSTWQQH